MAQCLDVRRERFVASDRFLLDSNVVLDLVAPFGRPNERARREAYSDFLTRARRAGAELTVSVLSFFEIAGVLERARFEDARGAPPTSRADLKAFRADAAARKQFVRELRSAWSNVVGFATIAGGELLAGDVASRYLPLLDAASLDGYDPGLVAESSRLRIRTIVTHDADFARVPNLIVLTANDKIL